MSDIELKWKELTVKFTGDTAPYSLRMKEANEILDEVEKPKRKIPFKTGKLKEMVYACVDKETGEFYSAYSTREMARDFVRFHRDMKLASLEIVKYKRWGRTS